MFVKKMNNWKVFRPSGFWLGACGMCGVVLILFLAVPTLMYLKDNPSHIYFNRSPDHWQINQFSDKTSSNTIIMLSDSLKQVQSEPPSLGQYNVTFSGNGGKGFDSTFVVELNASSSVSSLPHFWQSTGFCPPDPHEAACSWFLSDDMKQNLAYIGAIPQSRGYNVRVHYLLRAVIVTGFRDGNPVYNFTCLDQFINLLYMNGLKPGFEIMGNPSGYFSDLENRTQVYAWKQLVYLVARRYMDIYGLGYVETWNFESWNEPKPEPFDGINMTHQGFRNYYDACSEGLKQADHRLQLGAPSGGCKQLYDPSRYCWVLLRHLNNGTNYFTGQTGIRVDFISVHQKGLGPEGIDVILQKEHGFTRLLHRHLPRLVHVPLFNDEADPLVTWSKPLTWRADSTYSSMVAKIIVQHVNAYFSNKSSEVSFQLLSNDNGFLSYQPHVFSQRTLLARFQVNITKPPHTEFIRKPGHTVMGLLALLGEEQLAVMKHLKGIDSDVGVLGSRHQPDPVSPQDSWQVAALVYYTHVLTFEKNAQCVTVNVTFSGLPRNCSDLVYVVYSLDSNHGNPWRVWTDAGSPNTPNVSLFTEMRKHEDAVRVAGPTPVAVSSKSVLTISQPLFLPGVLLLHLCAKSAAPPDQVSELRIEKIFCNQVLVVWSDSCVNTKCLQRYEVEFSVSGMSGTFSRINCDQDSIFTVFVYRAASPDESCSAVSGYYRVRAVDYWNRAGEFSLTVHFLS